MIIAIAVACIIVCIAVIVFCIRIFKENRSFIPKKKASEEDDDLRF